MYLTAGLAFHILCLESRAAAAPVLMWEKDANSQRHLSSKRLLG